MTGMVMVTKCEDQQSNLSLVDFFLAVLRKSVVSCRVDQRRDEGISAFHNMEIGWPTNVQHVAHVTFDRFNGFLGLPVEVEVEVEAEGIFRINPENSKEEEVRSQLNRGIVPNNIDVHCVAGLIKAWFRELPLGVLDGLSPEQVLECNTEKESVELVKQLPPTEAALLNWAVDLMADVVEQEDSNKMNPRNIAMVFAPNMTQKSDPLTTLMHAVQVMNLLKTLITRTLRQREEAANSPMSFCSSDQTADGEIDSHQEMDTSCELSISEYDDHTHCRNSSEDEDEDESLSEIEECFLQQLDYKNDANRDLSTSDGEDSGENLIADRLNEELDNDLKLSSNRWENTEGVEMVDKLESVFPVPLVGV